METSPPLKFTPGLAAGQEVVNTFEASVVMSCSGCSGAVKNKLKKLEGVIEYATSLPTQLVVAKTTAVVTSLIIGVAIIKTGKKVETLKLNGVLVDLESIREAAKA